MRYFLLSIFLWGAAVAHAAIDPYEFDKESQRERYQQFIDDLRCPKCQNQNLAGSDAPIAADLRQELRRLLKENKTDREIVDFMVARYGEFVLYDPPFDKKTAVLWLAPIGFLAIGLIVLMAIARRRATTVAAPAELTESERAQLQQMLHDDKNPGDKNA